MTNKTAEALTHLEERTAWRETGARRSARHDKPGSGRTERQLFDEEMEHATVSVKADALRKLLIAHQQLASRLEALDQVNDETIERAAANLEHYDRHLEADAVRKLLTAHGELSAQIPAAVSASIEAAAREVEMMSRGHAGHEAVILLEAVQRIRKIDQADPMEPYSDLEKWWPRAAVVTKP